MKVMVTSKRSKCFEILESVENLCIILVWYIVIIHVEVLIHNEVFKNYKADKTMTLFRITKSW